MSLLCYRQTPKQTPYSFFNFSRYDLTRRKCRKCRKLFLTVSFSFSRYNLIRRKYRKQRKLFLSLSSISHDIIRFVGNIGKVGNNFFPFLPISHENI